MLHLNETFHPTFHVSEFSFYRTTYQHVHVLIYVSIKSVELSVAYATNPQLKTTCISRNNIFLVIAVNPSVGFLTYAHGFTIFLFLGKNNQAKKSVQLFAMFYLITTNNLLLLFETFGSFFNGQNRQAVIRYASELLSVDSYSSKLRNRSDFSGQGR